MYILLGSCSKSFVFLFIDNQKETVTIWENWEWKTVPALEKENIMGGLETALDSLKKTGRI